MSTWKELKDEQHDAHDFTKEKVLEGILVEKRVDIGPNKSLLFVIEKAGGDKVSVWGSSVLNKLSKVRIGTMLRIEFTGLVKGKGPKPYKNYSIQLDEESIPAEGTASDDINF